MLPPSAIELSGLLRAQFQFGFTFVGRQTLPKNHRELGSLACGKLQEFGKRRRRHTAILASNTRLRNACGENEPAAHAHERMQNRLVLVDTEMVSMRSCHLAATASARCLRGRCLAIGSSSHAVVGGLGRPAADILRAFVRRQVARVQAGCGSRLCAIVRWSSIRRRATPRTSTADRFPWLGRLADRGEQGRPARRRNEPPPHPAP